MILNWEAVLLIRPRIIETLCPIHSAFFAEWVGGSVAFLWDRISKSGIRLKLGIFRDRTRHEDGVRLSATVRRTQLSRSSSSEIEADFLTAICGKN